MRISILVLALVLSLAATASAQYTIVVSTDANSNGTTVHESIVESYTPQCGSCSNATHTYTGSLTDPAAGRQCQFNWVGAASSSVNTGCSLDITLDGVNMDFTGQATVTNRCTVMGTFLYIAVITLPKIGVRFGNSNYRNIECRGNGNIWVCDVMPSGTNCPAKCTTRTSIPVIGKPDKFTQCEDIQVNGVCAGGACVEQSFNGFCANP